MLQYLFDKGRLNMELTEITKSKVCTDIKTYILGEWKEKTNNKKFAKLFSAEIEKATESQFRFGDPPSYEKGYVCGNVTAEGYDYKDGTEYTRTISVDMETPEYTFFDINKNNSAEVELCKQACTNIPHMKKYFYAAEQVRSRRPESKIYICNDEDEALRDFAIKECKKQFARINFELRSCRVNDYDYVQTESPKICDYYPIYLDTKDKKGNPLSMLIGYYNPDDDNIDYNIDVPLTLSDKLMIAAIIGVPVVIIAIVMHLLQ